MKTNKNINLGKGNTSKDKFLGKYYQDFTPAITHFHNESILKFDKDDSPILSYDNYDGFIAIVIIQLGIISHDLLLNNNSIKQNELILIKCINWLDENKEEFKDSFVWRSEYNQHYNLEKGWISGMYQGQAISLYLRAYQLFNNYEYLETAKKIYNSFKYDYSEGGFKRIDEYGCIWFEEYPTINPSYVLNGFIYSMFGILDYYRITNDESAKKLWDSCVNTLKTNLGKYDVWYWSVYDQLNKELVSYYYQKNVHLPLMQIMFSLTKEATFDKYAKKWEKNLNNSLHNLITKVMYRLRPRIIKLIK